MWISVHFKVIFNSGVIVVYNSNSHRACSSSDILGWCCHLSGVFTSVWEMAPLNLITANWPQQAWNKVEMNLIIQQRTRNVWHIIEFTFKSWKSLLLVTWYSVLLEGKFEILEPDILCFDCLSNLLKNTWKYIAKFHFSLTLLSYVFGILVKQ